MLFPLITALPTRGEVPAAGTAGELRSRCGCIAGAEACPIASMPFGIALTWTFAGIDLLNTGGFALDFGKRSIATAFSITGIQESGTFFLLGAGPLGLALRGRAA